MAYDKESAYQVADFIVARLDQLTQGFLYGLYESVAFDVIPGRVTLTVSHNPVDGRLLLMLEFVHMEYIYLHVGADYSGDSIDKAVLHLISPSKIHDLITRAASSHQEEADEIFQNLRLISLE